ncbi:hypothetical protein RHMOL_Rhmol10G0163200 [Rhododendron molle]|uniref:Uncharacterized protein n=1 Tax=Rhododendron molle TaxID=49168 RepID=A0ACC0M3Y9_RHOML|nr:hypothetical protein RHMOL_Rhmol10G0163200 [Rhododendron molle]
MQRSWLRVETNDDVVEKYLSYYTEGETIPDTRRQLGAILPLIDSVSDAIHLCSNLGCNPTVNIVSVEQPRPYVALSDDCSIMVLDAPPADLWDVDEIVDLNKNPLPDDLWDVNKVVDINMGNEFWTVNTALMDGGFWDVPFVTNPRTPFEEAAVQDPAFWEGLVIDDLEWDLTPGQDLTTTVASVDKGKRKMEKVQDGKSAA